MSTMKTCTACGDTKPRDAFYSRSGKCKPCANAASRQYRVDNIESVRAYDRQRRCGTDAERERKAKYVGRYNERIAAWRRENRDKCLAVGSAYEARRRARELKATPAWADHQKIAVVYANAVYLRSIGIDVQVDHVLPLQGRLVCGLHVENNLQLILASENRKKSASLLPEHTAHDIAMR